MLLDPFHCSPQPRNQWNSCLPGKHYEVELYLPHWILISGLPNSHHNGTFISTHSTEGPFLLKATNPSTFLRFLPKMIPRASEEDSFNKATIIPPRISFCLCYFLIDVIKHPDKNNLRIKGFILAQLIRIWAGKIWQLARQAWWQEQRAGWLHWIHIQKEESKQEVRPGF